MRTPLPLLLLSTLATPLLAQGVAPSSRANRALVVGIVATAVPTAAGIAVAAADGGHTPELILLGTGVMLGPAIGNFSGGLAGRGMLGMGLRAAAFGVGLLVGSGGCTSNCDDSGDDAGPLVGSAAALGLAIWDLAGLRRAVRRREEEAVSVMPTYDPVRRGAGMVVRVAF